MEFTPNYKVSYRGEFHDAGIPFDIDEKDVEEMSAHGMVSGYEKEKPEPLVETEEIINVENHENEDVNNSENAENSDDEQPRRGRSKKSEQ